MLDGLQGLLEVIPRPGSINLSEHLSQELVAQLQDTQEVSVGTDSNGKDVHIQYCVVGAPEGSSKSCKDNGCGFCSFIFFVLLASLMFGSICVRA